MNKLGVPALVWVEHCFMRKMRDRYQLGTTLSLGLDASTDLAPRLRQAELSGILGIGRNLWEDGSDLARHAKGFIEHGLKAGREAHAQSAFT